MTTIRNFDALNDVRNLLYSGQCITNAGLNHEVVIALMGLPPGLEGAHTPEFYRCSSRYFGSQCSLLFCMFQRCLWNDTAQHYL